MRKNVNQQERNRMTPGTTASSSPAAAVAPPRELIAERAYDLFLKNGSCDGHCEENWFEAERQLSQPPPTEAENRMENEGGGSAVEPAPQFPPKPSSAVRPPLMSEMPNRSGGSTQQQTQTQSGNSGS